MAATARSGPPGPPAEIVVGDVTVGTQPALELTRIARGVYRADLQLPRGDPGPPGPAANQLTGTAGHDISGHRIVTPGPTGDLIYAQPENPDGPLLLTTSAALQGDLITVAAIGPVDEPSWRWTPGQAIYLGPNGTLTAHPAQTGSITRFATATDTTSIFIHPQVPIVLTA